jgi:hypothetical protein
MRKTIAIILITLYDFNFAFSQKHNEYSFENGNLTLKINSLVESPLKNVLVDATKYDKIIRYAEYCSVITNSLLSNEKVYLDITTLKFNGNDDFLISYGNGKTESYSYVYPYINGVRTKTKMNQKYYSLDSNQLVIRYNCKEPDLNKLIRIVYSSFLNIDYIKHNQKHVEYEWLMLSYWYTQSMDSLIIDKWSKNTENDSLLHSKINTYEYKSKMCYNFPKFNYYYQDSKHAIRFYEKSSNNYTGFEFENLFWFAVDKEFGIFATSDSSLFIIDSENKKISNIYKLPVPISSFQRKIFAVQSKYAVKFSMFNTDDIGFVKDKFSLIYRPLENIYIDVTELDNKQVKEYCLKKYWH